MSKQLAQRLHSDFQTIEAALRHRIKDAYTEESNKLYQEKGLSADIEKVARLQKKGDQLQEQIADLEREIERGKGFAEKNVPEELVELGCPSYRPNETEVQTYSQVKKRSEGQNLFRFLQIKGSVESMFDLAVNNKERRNIILNFQNRDWRQLGVDLPPMNALDGFSIEDGEIRLTDSQQLTESK